MTAQNTTTSIKDRIAMFQKLNSGSVPSPPPQKKQVFGTTTKPNPVSVSEKAPQNKNSGQVESPPVVKPNLIKQSQQPTLSTSVNGSPNKLASSFTNNPWVQQASTAKVQQKKAPVFQVTSVKQSKGQSQQSPTLKHTFSANIDNGVDKSPHQKIVKITQNALVDKESLPSQNAMKLLIEGRLGGLIGLKKPQQPPKKIIVEVDSGPKQIPVVQTDVKIGNVKASTEQLNNFFQAKGSQKHQASSEQAKLKKQAQSQASHSQKEKQSSHSLNEKQSQSIKRQQVKNVQGVEQVSQQGNSQNIKTELVFSQPQPAKQITQTNVLNTPVLGTSLAQPAATESKGPIGQVNSLATHLQKRKKMTKKIFDSDED